MYIDEENYVDGPDGSNAGSGYVYEPTNYQTSISDGGGLAGAAEYLFGGSSSGSQTSLVDSFLSSVGEGLSLAYQNTGLPEFVGSLVNYQGANAQNFMSGVVSGANTATQDKPKDKSWWDMADKFLSDDKNKMRLLELGFGAVAGIAKNSAAKDAAKLKAQADTALLTQKDKLEQDANKRFSDSISGLKPVQKFKPKPLTRMDGSRVFTPTGLINTGAK